MNRDKQVNRAQFDEAAAKFNGQRCHFENRIDGLTVRAESAESELARARRLIVAIQAKADMLTDDLKRERDAHAHTRGLLARMVAARETVYRSWLKASRLLRLLPPETIQSLRNQADA